MLRTIRELVGGVHERVLYECRHCGASVDEEGERCPECGGGEIAEFTF